jgi:hypothetical protein
VEVEMGMPDQESTKRRQHGIPRDSSTYRGWKRNNAIKWLGVKTKRQEYPLLEKRVSKRGEVHYGRVLQTV